MYTKIKTLLRLSRIEEYILILLLIFPLIYLIAPDMLLSSLSIKLFISNLFLTAFNYSINDIEDAEDDFYDLKKRLRNPISSNDLSKNQSIIFSLVLLIGGLYALYLINSIVLTLGIINITIGFLYSWKRVRLKSTPVLDLVSHVIFLGTIQFFTIYLTFRSLDFHIIPFLMIIIPFSVMNEMFGELRDFNVDKITDITNTIQKLEKDNLRKIIMGLTFLAILGFTLVMLTFPAENRLINLPLSLTICLSSLLKIYNTSKEVLFTH